MQASPSASSLPSTTARADVIIDCSHTRYHVVRAAARMIGWVVSDDGTEEVVPESFHGVPLSLPTDEPPAHPPQVLWVDKSVVASRVAGLRCYQRLNHFAAMHVIARKALLFRRLMQLSRLAARSNSTAAHDGAAGAAVRAAPSSSLRSFLASSIPPSFSSLGDRGRLAAFQEELRTTATEPSSFLSTPYFIIKPNTGCEGRGIRLSPTPLDELTEAEQTDKKRECIIQLYVDRPLLWNGKKFDLRLYVLLTSVTPPHSAASTRRRSSPCGAASRHAAASSEATYACEEGTAVPAGVEGVRLYIHREGLVRICAEPYAAPTEANRGRAVLHLTNYAVNKRSALFRPAEDPDEDEDKESDAHGLQGGGRERQHEEGNKRSLAALADYVTSMKFPGGWAAVQRRIDECVALTVLSGVEVLRRELISVGGARGDRADGHGCFELLGFDILLRGGTLDPVVMEVNHSPSLFCDTAFDFAVKSTVLRDTFRLIEAHLPQWDAFQGSGSTYAACTKPGSAAAARMARAEAALLLHGGAETGTEAGSFGFRSLLPHYTASAVEGKMSLADWRQEERAAQKDMVRLSRQLP